MCLEFQETTLEKCSDGHLMATDKHSRKRLGIFCETSARFAKLSLFADIGSSHQGVDIHLRPYINLAGKKYPVM